MRGWGDNELHDDDTDDGKENACIVVGKSISNDATTSNTRWMVVGIMTMITDDEKCVNLGSTSSSSFGLNRTTISKIMKLNLHETYMRWSC